MTVVARGTHGGDSAPGPASTVARPTTPEPPATVTTDGNGAFPVPVTVPTGLGAGKHSFVALGVDPDGEPLATPRSHGAGGGLRTGRRQ